MDRILGIGNALVDALVVVKEEKLLDELHLPKGSMQLIDRNTYEAITARTAKMEGSKATGGSAANTILSLAHLGAKPGFIGKVSHDDNGKMYVEQFEQKGVKMIMQYDELPTGICTSFVTPDGQRTMATYLGAAVNMQPEELTAEMFEGYTYIYIEGYLVQNHALITRIVNLAKEVGLKIVLDLASYNVVEDNREFFTRLLQDVDIVFANEDECEAFTGKSVRKGLAEIAQLCNVAVVKVGKDGVWVQRDNEIVQVAAVDVPKVIDTTGAGDAFAAGFLYAYARHHSLERCAVVGNLVAGEIIQGLGAGLDSDRWEQLVKKVERVLQA